MRPVPWSVSLAGELLLLMILRLASPPQDAPDAPSPWPQVSQEGTDVVPVHLERWWARRGDIPGLRGPADGLDATQLAAANRQAVSGESGWVEATLPWHFEPARGHAAESLAESSTWLLTEFTVDPMLQGRALVLWMDHTEAFARVYLNGEWIGTHGTFKEGTPWMRTPFPAVYTLPASMLSTEHPNSLAVFVHNPLLSVQVADAQLMDPRAAPQTVFLNRTLWLLAQAAVGALLLGVTVYLLLWYMSHREEYENLFLVVGLCSYLASYGIGWIPWTPWSGACVPAIALTCFPLANFITVFFQHHYRIHRHPAWSYGIAAWAAVDLLGVWLLSPPQMVAMLTWILPLAQLGFAYGLYLNWRAARAGHADAPTVLWGYGIYTACVGFDILTFIFSNLSVAFVSSLGMAALAVSIVASITRRFSAMEKTRQQVVEDLRRRQELQDFLVAQIAEAAGAIEVTSGHILSSAGQQQFGATDQSSSVEETRRTMESLLASGRTITTAAHDVLRNAEMTQQHNHAVAQRVGESSNHSRRISEILDIIRDIANKTELLALNAALEGSRAGEAGRGFALVATQMQRLAENVMSAVADIKDLTIDIHKVSGATQASTLQAAQLAAETTESAHKIGLIIQEQQVGTEQVTRAMDDVAKIATQTAQSGQTTLERTLTLIEKARFLRALVEKHHTGSAIVRQDALRGG